MSKECVICKGTKFPYGGSKVCEKCFERLYNEGTDLKEYLCERFPKKYTYLCENYPELVLAIEDFRLNNEFLKYISLDFCGASVVAEGKAIVCYSCGGFETLLHEILHCIFRVLELDADLEEKIVSLLTDVVSEKLKR